MLLMKELYLICLTLVSLSSLPTVRPTQDLLSFSPMPMVNSAVSEPPTLLKEINAYRQANGWAALIENSQLDKAAQRQSDDCAKHARLDHIGTDGSRPEQRVEAAGFAWSAVAENIAQMTKPEKTVAAWAASPGHNRNMLGDYKFVGIATTKGDDGDYYSTAVFANPPKP